MCMRLLKLESGEINKNIATCTSNKGNIYQTLDADRKSLMINFGGVSLPI